MCDGAVVIIIPVYYHVCKYNFSDTYLCLGFSLIVQCLYRYGFLCIVQKIESHHMRNGVHVQGLFCDMCFYIHITI